jgi:hypothetical protein
MKHDARIRANEKKIRSANENTTETSEGERKKLTTIRTINTPVAENGAYCHLTKSVRKRGIIYSIHIVNPWGVTISMYEIIAVRAIIYASTRNSVLSFWTGPGKNTCSVLPSSSSMQTLFIRQWNYIRRSIVPV